jgi:hypothetical protein
MFTAGTLPTRIAVFGLLLLVPARASAQIPARASAQGRRLPASGSSRYTASPAARTTGAQHLAETFELYLSSSSDYQKGDLLWRSQLEEFQEYLKRTGRCSEATHSKWLRRTLQDRSPLVLFFHTGGRHVLRRAAKKMGGYAEMDLFSHTGQGKKIIQRAIETGSEAELVDALRAQRAEAVQRGIAQQRPLPIYSAQDFLQSLTPRTESAQRLAPEAGRGR